MYSHCCAAVTRTRPQNTLHLVKQKLCPSTSPQSHPPALETTAVLPASLSVAPLSSKNHHATSASLCLACFTQHNVLKVHPSCGRWQNAFFLFFSSMLNNIPFLHVPATFSLASPLSPDARAALTSWPLCVTLLCTWGVRTSL